MRENLRDARLRLGRNIKRLRDLRGLSQERLAELASTTNKHLGQVERGQVSPTFDKLMGIADGLSVNIVELFRTLPPNTPRLRTFLFTERELDQIEQSLLIVARKTKRAARRRD
jgi:transcriptional regulator with XRE-family HTH domain